MREKIIKRHKFPFPLFRQDYTVHMKFLMLTFKSHLKYRYLETNLQDCRIRVACEQNVLMSFCVKSKFR